MLFRSYARHATAVYAFVNRRLTIASAAEEVTNDTFLHAWRGAGSFEDAKQTITQYENIEDEFIIRNKINSDGTLSSVVFEGFTLNASDIF